MIPNWADDTSIALKTYNARNETLLQKASFINAVSICMLNAEIGSQGISTRAKQSQSDQI